MDDDVRRELIGYFERDVGRPPLGARERVLAGLGGPSHRARRRYLAWASGAAAVLLAALTVVTLLGIRGVTHGRPAGQGEAPPPRAGAAVAYDARRGVLVVFGGTTDNRSDSDETWTWDGRRWTRLHPATSPPPVRDALMTYDAAREMLVLHGVPGSTWTWDGRTWLHHSTAPPPAGPSGSAAIAYDPASRGVLLYVAPAEGGHQTWRWDGTSWTELRPATTPDVVRGGMAFDGRHLLLFGDPFGAVRGQFVTQTWAWDGTDWSLLSPAVRLPGSFSYSAAYDQARGRLVTMVDPEGLGSETWVWDGTSWGREHPQHEPPSRQRTVIQYDAAARRVVLYGGLDARSAALGDIWAWDGSDWRLLEETQR